MQPRAFLIALPAAVAALALGACGEDEDSSASGLTSIVPADVPLYIEGEVRPDGADGDAIASLSSKLAGIDDPGGMIIDELERSAAEQGEDISYTEDIEPWLGQRAGLFIGSFEGLGETEEPEQFGGVIETTDAEAAREFVEKQAEGSEDEVEQSSYESVDYWVDEDGLAVGLVEDTLAIADEDSFRRVVDAANGDSLAGSDDYGSTLETVGGQDQLATVYLDFGAVLDAMVASGELPEEEFQAVESLYGGLFDEPLAAAAEVTDGSVAIDMSVPNPQGFETEGSDALGGAPEDAWLSVGIADLGAYFEESLAQIERLGPQLGEPELSQEAIAGAFQTLTGLDLEDDVLAWMGDANLWVQGSSERDLEIGVSVATSDESATTRALDAARQAISQDPSTAVGPPLGGAETGFTAENKAGEGFIDVELADGEVTLVFSRVRGSAKPPDGASLDSSRDFGAAMDVLGSDYTPAAFLSFEPLVEFIRSTGESVDPVGERVLGALGAVAVGTRPGDDRVDARLGVTVP
jgi:hypothetical protein